MLKVSLMCELVVLIFCLFGFEDCENCYDSLVVGMCRVWVIIRLLFIVDGLVLVCWLCGVVFVDLFVDFDLLLL